MSRPPANEMRNYAGYNTASNGLIDFQDPYYKNMAAMSTDSALMANQQQQIPFTPTVATAGGATVYGITPIANISPYTTQTAAMCYPLGAPMSVSSPATVAATGHMNVFPGTTASVAGAVGGNGASFGAAGAVPLQNTIVMGPPSEVHVHGKVYRMVEANASGSSASKKLASSAATASTSAAAVSGKKVNMDKSIEDRVARRVQEFMARSSKSTGSSASSLSSRMSSGSSGARSSALASPAAGSSGAARRLEEQQFLAKLAALSRETSSSSAAGSAARRSMRRRVEDDPKYVFNG